MGLVCSCGGTDMRKDYESYCGSRDKLAPIKYPDQSKGTFFFENGPIQNFEPAVMNQNGDYLNRLIDSSENYWKGKSNNGLKDRHRPITQCNINGI
eukprot:403374858